MIKSLQRAGNYASLSAMGASGKFCKPLKKAMQRSMARKMTGMKGIPMKVAQILGMGDSNSAETFQQAQEDIDLMPVEQVLALLKEHSPQFLSIATLQKECRGASLGQVNRFQGEDHDFAVKLQYPDSEENLKMDNQALQLVSSTFANFSKGFEMNDYSRVFRDELTQELDYERELRLQQRFHELFVNDYNIVIPAVFPQYSNRSCLVMNWEPALSLQQFLDCATEEQKKQAGQLVTKIYIDSIFGAGLIHADPNYGNFAFRLVGDDVQLVVYDFGSIEELSEEEHLSLLSLFQLCQYDKNPAPALIMLGFDKDLLEAVYSQLPALMMVLLDPFFSIQRFEFSKWNRREKVQDILGEQRWNFMAAAPAKLFLFMRSIYGLFHYSDKLAGGLFCQPQIQKIINARSIEITNLLEARQNDLLPVENNGLSKHLFITVLENGQQKVKLTLPGRAIDKLDTLIPPDVCKKLVEQNIDLTELI